MQFEMLDFVDCTRRRIQRTLILQEVSVSEGFVHSEPCTTRHKTKEESRRTTFHYCKGWVLSYITL